MLEQIDNLPPGVWGVRATGKVSRADYERVVVPALERARVEGRRIRRVAVAVDGALAQLGPALVDHFVHAELKQFGADDLEPAIVWAGNPPPGASEGA